MTGERSEGMDTLRAHVAHCKICRETPHRKCDEGQGLVKWMIALEIARWRQLFVPLDVS